MRLYSFEGLSAWQTARTLTGFVYRATQHFPKAEHFGIVDQMRRAAISVCSNLAEGSSKTTGKEKARYSSMAFCSLMELLNQVIISADLDYLSDQEVEELRTLIDEIAAKTTRLRAAQLNQR
jgi:four helix bundle protein